MDNRPSKKAVFITMTLLILLTGLPALAQTALPATSQVFTTDSLLWKPTPKPFHDSGNLRMPIAPLPGNEAFHMPVIVPDTTVTYHLKIQGYPPESAIRFIPDSSVNLRKKLKPGFPGEVYPEHPFREEP